MNSFIWAIKGYWTLCAAIGMCVNVVALFYLLSKRIPRQTEKLTEKRFEFAAPLVAITLAYLVVISVVAFVEPKEPSMRSEDLKPTLRSSELEFDFESTGQFGDSFGFLNAVLAIFIACTAIETYKAQRAQLDAQNQQLVDERKARVEDHVSQQFYVLVQTYRDMLNSVSFNGWHSDQSYTGLSALLAIENALLGKLNLQGEFRELLDVKTFIKDFPDGDFSSKEAALLYLRVQLCRNVESRSSGEFDPLSRQQVSVAFGRFFELVIGAQIGHLLRTQIEIIRFINNELAKQNIDAAVARNFVETFRTMLSDPEMHLLLYFALRNANDDEMIRLVDDNRLLLNLLAKPPEFVIHRIPELSYFPATCAAWDNRMGLTES